MRRIWGKLSVVLAFAMIILPLHASALDRAAATFSNGDVHLKEGTVGNGWRQLTGGVSVGNVSLSMDRISLLDSGNSQKSVSIKEPLWNSSWERAYYSDGGEPLASKALVSQLSDGQYRLLVLRADGSVVMKDGPYNTGWWSGTVEASDVTDIVIGGDRIGVITGGGDFKVKELQPRHFSHPSNVAWELVATGASTGKAALSSTRLAYIDSSNNAYVKEGAVTAPWFDNKAVIHSLSAKVRLAGNRVCSLGMGARDGVVECKEGALNTQPTQTYSSDASDVKITSNRVAVVTNANIARLLEGPLYGANSGWQTIGTSVSAIELN